MTTHRDPPLSATVAVRFPPHEAEAIRQLARQLGVPYSEVVRRAVTAYLTPPTAPAETVTVDADAVWSQLA
jgi:hypothetical protein